MTLELEERRKKLQRDLNRDYQAVHWSVSLAGLYFRVTAQVTTMNPTNGARLKIWVDNVINAMESGNNDLIYAMVNSTFSKIADQMQMYPSALEGWSVDIPPSVLHGGIEDD